jgi:hypothetical protein
LLLDLATLSTTIGYQRKPWSRLFIFPVDKRYQSFIRKLEEQMLFNFREDYDSVVHGQLIMGYAVFEASSKRDCLISRKLPASQDMIFQRAEVPSTPRWQDPCGARGFHRWPWKLAEEDPTFLAEINLLARVGIVYDQISQ